MISSCGLSCALANGFNNARTVRERDPPVSRGDLSAHHP